MTSPNKMQALFDAALRADPQPKTPLERAVPEAKLDVLEDSPATPAVEPQSSATQTQQPNPASSIQAVEFNKEEAEELGALLDEQMSRSKKKRKRELVLTLLVLGGSTVGALGWFVSDGTRVQAFKDVVADIRSVSDVTTIVSKFQASLDRISVRSAQIDQATAALGVTVKPGELKDETMEAEMKQMMGEAGGRTVGERNKMLQQSFGNRAKEAGGVPAVSKEAAEKLKKFREENAFEWNK